MVDEARGYLIRQFETAWKLTSIHLNGLVTEECLWRPAHEGLHVHQVPDGKWHPDWPDHEGYHLGPPSIAWLTWHIGFWWSMVLNHSFGDGTVSRENLEWPGDADAVREWLVPPAETVASGTRAGHRRGPAVGTANTLAFSGPSVWGRRCMGQCRAHEERRRNRLRTLPVRRPPPLRLEQTGRPGSPRRNDPCLGTAKVGQSFETVVADTLTPTSSGGTLLALEHSGFLPSNAFAFDGATKGWRYMGTQRLRDALARIA
jgi:hypothetical protein